MQKNKKNVFSFRFDFIVPPPHIHTIFVVPQEKKKAQNKKNASAPYRVGIEVQAGGRRGGGGAKKECATKHQEHPRHRRDRQQALPPPSRCTQNQPTESTYFIIRTFSMAWPESRSQTTEPQTPLKAYIFPRLPTTRRVMDDSGTLRPREARRFSSLRLKVDLDTNSPCPPRPRPRKEESNEKKVQHPSKFRVVFFFCETDTSNENTV